MALGLQMVAGDFVINPNGSVAYVTDTAKATRDFIKMMQTPTSLNTNTTVDNGVYRYNPTYGNRLVSIKALGSMTQDQIIASVNLILAQDIQNYVDAQDARADQSLGEIILALNYNVYFKTHYANTPEVLNTVYITFTMTTPSTTISVGTFSQQVS